MHHEEQDHRSWQLHCAAIELMKSDPEYIDQALAILARWESMGESQSLGYWIEWRKILTDRDWDEALSLSQRAAARRQASPCSCILPDQQRLDIIGVSLPDRVARYKLSDLMAEMPPGELPLVDGWDSITPVGREV